MGGLVGKIPIICGGYYNTDSDTDECYKISSRDVVLVGKMSTNRRAAASLLINDTLLWKTGGTRIMTFLNSSEFFNSEGITMPGPQLPIKLRDHLNLKY